MTLGSPLRTKANGNCTMVVAPEVENEMQKISHLVLSRPCRPLLAVSLKEENYAFFLLAILASSELCRSIIVSIFLDFGVAIDSVYGIMGSWIIVGLQEQIRMI